MLMAQEVEMKITYFSSTEEIVTEFGNRVRRMRIDSNRTQKALAEEAGLSVRTLSNLESGKETSFATVIEVLRVLNRVEGLDGLVPEETVRPSAVFAGEKPRERAGKRKAEPESGWKWGDES